MLWHALVQTRSCLAANEGRVIPLGPSHPGTYYPRSRRRAGRRREVRSAPLKARGDRSCWPNLLKLSSRAGPRFSFRSRSPRRTPGRGEAAIEAYAASIAAKGILQHLVVEPELDGDGSATGFYFVTIGEGRRLAQLLRVKRREIKKTEPIRCIVDTSNDPHEISLDENVTRENMHDQFEASKKLADERGMSVEDSAARFGVTAHVVRQRLRLAAISLRLMQVYRDGGLTLEQLTAFAITEDHARQEAVFDPLTYNRDASTIRRMLTETHVPATERRARFVGIEADMEAGGTLLRDLFTEDRGGYLEDVALLDLLVTAKLGREADRLREAEGWKWALACLDFPHAHGMRRVYPHPVELSSEDQAALDAAKSEVDHLSVVGFVKDPTGVAALHLGRKVGRELIYVGKVGLGWSRTA
jgi:ParB family chromosome partitioning protein